jgi:hypothetical protein
MLQTISYGHLKKLTALKIYWNDWLIFAEGVAGRTRISRSRMSIDFIVISQ